MWAAKSVWLWNVWSLGSKVVRPRMSHARLACFVFAARSILAHAAEAVRFPAWIAQPTVPTSVQHVTLASTRSGTIARRAPASRSRRCVCAFEEFLE